MALTTITFQRMHRTSFRNFSSGNANPPSTWGRSCNRLPFRHRRDYIIQNSECKIFVAKFVEVVYNLRVKICKKTKDSRCLDASASSRNKVLFQNSTAGQGGFFIYLVFKENWVNDSDSLNYRTDDNNCFHAPSPPEMNLRGKPTTSWPLFCWLYHTKFRLQNISCKVGWSCL